MSREPAGPALTRPIPTAGGAGSARLAGPSSGPAPVADPTGLDPYPGAVQPRAPLTPRERQSRDGGARPVTDERRDRRTPLAWLPWAALAALLLLLGLSFLAARLADGGDSAGNGSPAASSGQTGQAGGEGGAGAGAGPGGGGTAAQGAGQLTAGSTDLLAGGQVGDLASLAGQGAVGRGLQVESVVADEGFWVGSSAQQRVFVFLTPEARQSAGESGFQVEAGQRIDVNGTVEPLGESAPAAFGVTEQEGASQLLEQAAYVSATQVRLSAS